MDQYGDAFVTGSTASANFPTVGSPTPYQKTYGGDTDAYVTMLRYDGEAVIYSSYLGGNNFDVGNGVAVDSSGDAYIVGSTSSSNFPVAPTNAFQISLAGTSNAFVAKLDPSGTHLLWSTYLGGSSIDYGLAIGIDPGGNAYVTGSTQSTNFPVLNPIQSGNGGNGDAFVTEVENGALNLVYSTYLGGSSADSGQGITVDVGGNAYVTGYTFSTNFPTFNAYQSTSGGSVDVFVASIKANGLGFSFSTYLGGKGDDRAWGITLDADRNIYIAGTSLTACAPQSTTITLCAPSPTFPTTSGAFQTYTSKQAPGYADGFVAKFDFTGANLLYSTMLGGSYTDSPMAIAVDSVGDAYVTGYTESVDFPTANALQSSYTGGTCGSVPCPDAFVTEVNTAGTSLLYSTFLGGSGANYGMGIAVDSNTNAYVVGTTTSSFFPVVAADYQGEPGNSTGLGQAFISMISHNNLPAVGLTPQKVNFGNVNENTTTNLNVTGQPAQVLLLIRVRRRLISVAFRSPAVILPRRTVALRAWRPEEDLARLISPSVPPYWCWSSIS